MFFFMLLVATGMVFGALFSLADAMEAGMPAELAAKSFWGTMQWVGIMVAYGIACAAFNRYYLTLRTAAINAYRWARS